MRDKTTSCAASQITNPPFPILFLVLLLRPLAGRFLCSPVASRGPRRGARREEMAVQLFPFLRCLRPLIRWPILLDEWRAEERLEFVARRHRDWGCCLLSGLRDELVPPAHMRRLYEVLERGRPRVLEMHTFEEGGHNDTPARGGDAYWEAFAGFLARLSEAAGEAEAPPADKDR